MNTQVKHPASVARLQTFVAFEGGEGIVDPLDLRVVALDVPGTAVRVMPGAGSIINRATGASAQSYAVQNYGTADEVEISATDSGGGRSDLLVVRIENPFLAGENFGLPPDPENGPYTYVRVVRGVPANTANYYDLEPGTYGDVTVAPTDSAITLARIDIPASTATIQQSYIQDLRSPIGFRRVADEVIQENPWFDVSKSSSDQWVIWADSTDSYITFPEALNWQIPVPEWATAMECIVQFETVMRRDSGPEATNPGIFGDALPVINGTSAGFTPTTFDWNWNGNPEIVPIRVLGTLPIKPEWRGTTISFRTKVRLREDASVRMYSSAGTYSTGQFHFKKTPSYT